MPRFATYFSLGVTQHQLDFVNVSNEHDTPVYVDPYAIEISDDEWAAQASAHIRSFFTEVLAALRDGNRQRATHLMSHLTEPKETFLGVSRGNPKGRGVGPGQARQLIAAISRSRAFTTGILGDLSEMALYVDGIDRDKVSDLTTNIIRSLLVDYTQSQCELFDIETEDYSGPPAWDLARKNWVSQRVQLPHIGQSPILLVPKYIVRRKLSLNSQEFYNGQITDHLVAEHYRANDSLVHVLQGGETKVYKTEVREAHPKSKAFIADVVIKHPDLLDLYKDIAKKRGALKSFGTPEEEEGPTLTVLCKTLAEEFDRIAPGAAAASDYHKLVLGAMTALFYPDLINPQKEWEIHQGRKRIDIVFTNGADTGFFAQRRGNPTNAALVIVECKNYSNDIANEEIDQLLGRFDRNRGYFGMMTCRNVDNPKLLQQRCKDAAVRQQGFIITLTDDDFRFMLLAKAELRDQDISDFLQVKYRGLLS